jgi:WXXGXW repeat (2 copies)
MKSITVRNVLVALCLSAALSACVYQARPGVVYEDVAVADVSPPPVQSEYVGVAPTPGYFWIGGVWFWEGGRHVWHPGHWEAPRAGYRYVPHRWEHVGNAWHLRGGRWERR